jgi:hypothetical protein
MPNGDPPRDGGTAQVEATVPLATRCLFIAAAWLVAASAIPLLFLLTDGATPLSSLPGSALVFFVLMPGGLFEPAGGPGVLLVAWLINLCLVAAVIGTQRRRTFLQGFACLVAVLILEAVRLLSHMHFP